ncbi:hypothetical protein EU527_12760 [Candidatus Thorarchaeota archaeon]|nr:MAG: hypothetical protein EU527_12760 [Candidatus Thorarchaeota archaeon]
MKIKLRQNQYLAVSIFFFTVLTAFVTIPINAWPDWPPGIYMGYAEDGEDMNPSGQYDYYDSFSIPENSSYEYMWFHWEEENFATTHESHFFSVWVWVDGTLDVAIEPFRNEYMHAQMWQYLIIDEGEEGDDEFLGTMQYTNTGSYTYWDDYICAIAVICKDGGSGNVHVRIFVTDS